PIIAVSVAGGDGQDQVTLQMLLNLIDFGLSPADAVTAPRFYTKHLLSSFRQALPELGNLQINPGVGDKTLAELAKRGHKIQLQEGPVWAPSVLTLDPASKRIQAAGDPTAGRHAAAY